MIFIEFARPDISEFIQLKMSIESHKRNYGYHIIDLIDIHPLKQKGIEGEQLLETLFSEWDKPTTPKIYSPPEDGSWSDYQTDLEDATNLAVLVLKGGGSVGHSVDTIPHEIAMSMVDKFAKLFKNPKAYIGMGLGSQDYAFQWGTVLIDANNAGILWVVEDD